jgi:protein MpaA
MNTNLLLTVNEFGKSFLNQSIRSYEFGNKNHPKILILGGVHGDEYEGVAAARELTSRFIKFYPYKLHITLVPEFNPDGVLLKQRMNGNLVDLNRNLPTLDWSPVVATPRYNPGLSAMSEPESKALVSWLDQNNPRLIISFHSWNPMININGDCEPEAQLISTMTGYIITPDIGYPTPGSLGTYAGHEKKIGTITYEIERGSAINDILRTHVPATLEALKISESRFR